MATGKPASIERCAYCREYVPVTVVGVEPDRAAVLTARVAVCPDCFGDGR